MYFIVSRCFPDLNKDHVFSVEYLPGQFDQRADSAEQCVQFIKEDESPVIKTATTYVIEGNVTEDEFAAIKNHCINLWTQEKNRNGKTGNVSDCDLRNRKM